MIAALLLLASAHADDPVAIADPGDGVRQVVWARRLELTAPFADTMQAGAPLLREGWLVQLAVDPRFDVVSQLPTPVLYAGAAPARPFDLGRGDGCVVALVHDGAPLDELRFFYGSTELPARVDAARGRAEEAAAVDKGVTPRPAAEVQQAITSGGGPLSGDVDLVWKVARERVAVACPAATGG